MNTLFWTNTIWYIALAAISLAMLFITLSKTTHRKKTFAFFFAVLGMTYLLEVLLLLAGDAYAYYPKIASDSFHESLIGSFFSAYSVTASAVLIATLGLGIWWRIGFSIVYFLADVLFVQLNIYSHNWYSSWFTLAGFYLYSWIVKGWHGKIFSHPSKAVYFTTLFLAVFSMYGNILGTTLNLMELRRLTIGLFDKLTKDNTAASILHGIITIAVMIPLYRLKLRTLRKALIFPVLFVADYVLYISGIIHVKAGWFVFSALVTLFGRYRIIRLMDRSLGMADFSHN